MTQMHRPISSARTTWAGVAVLLGTLAAAVGVSLALGGDDPTHRRAVSLAALTTGCGALTGWLVARWGRGREAATAVATGLGSTLMRIAPALAALAWLSLPDNPLRESRAPALLVSFYLVLLAADVGLNMMVGERGPRTGGRDTAN
jgi:hypothetical protein